VLTETTLAALDAHLAAEQAAHRLPSVVAGLVREGELVWSGAAGAGTVDHQYRCGSITKTFVAVQVLRLRDAGRLQLTDLVEQHVPGTSIGRSTVAQLLAHSAGLRAETAGPWWERTPGTSFRELASASLGPDAARARPGRRFHYSNVGYAVLGELVARQHGRPWHDVLADELLAPLGMARTTLRPQEPAAAGFAVHPFADVLLPEPEHDHDAMAPAGQLWTTVADLARWAGLLAGRHPELLAAATLEEMLEPQVVDDRPGAAWTAAHALGVQGGNADARRSHGHGGSMPGFLAGLRVDAETGDAAISMCNSTSGLSHDLGAELLTILGPGPVTPWAPSAVAPDVLALTGSWFWGPSHLLLRATPDGLELTPAAGAGRGSRFVATDGGWRGRDGYYADEQLRVVRHPDGTVSHLDLASFVLTRTPYDDGADVPGGLDPAGWR
jgi:CubicO group peptidase (beta-lactamase class C family)